MKLPKPIKRGQTYRITVTYENKKIFMHQRHRKECEQWAAMKLLELKSGKVQEKGIKTPYPFKMLCEKYYAEKGVKLRSKHVIRNKLDNLERIVGELASKSIYDFKPSDIARWRNKRVLEVKMEPSYMNSLFFLNIYLCSKGIIFN